MKKLTGSQKQLLVNAAGRRDGKVLPVPDGMNLKGGALTSTLNALEKRGLVVRRKGSRAAVVITAKGRDAAGPAVSGNTHMAKTDPAKRPTKAARIISLLTRPDGATVPEIMRETHWQRHSVRAALTGLRKRGMAVSRTVSDSGIGTYRIEGSVPS